MKFLESEVHRLVRDCIPESRTHDFKRQFYGRNEQDKHELAKDVSALANTRGGMIIIGIDDRSTPYEIVGIPGSEFDTEGLRMTSILSSALEPKAEFHLERVQMHGKTIMVLSVPASYLSPHRVKFNNQTYFYTRTNSRVESMDIFDIRQAFSITGGLFQKAREFRTERLQRIRRGDTPVPINDGVVFAIHILSLGTNNPLELYSPDSFPSQLRIQFVGTDSCPPRRFNFEGAVYSYWNQQRPAGYYGQVFRNGSMEFVVSRKRPEQNSLSQMAIERDLLMPLYCMLPYAFELNSGPFAIFLSISGCKDLKVGIHHWDEERFTVDEVPCPEVILDKLPTSVHELRQHISVPLDVVMQSAGYERAAGLTEEGTWKFA